MKLEGGCYCGAVRYEAEGDPILKAQCHCRACQHITGGAPNYFMLMPLSGFRFTKGEPKTYTRPDKADAVTRAFCGTCGTHLTTSRPGLQAVILKIGTLDEPALYGGPSIAIFTEENRPSTSCRRACRVREAAAAAIARHCFRLVIIRRLAGGDAQEAGALQIRPQVLRQWWRTI